MLRLMLSCHPSIGIPPEGGFAVLLGWKYDRIPFDRARTRRNFVDDFFELESAMDWGFTKSELANSIEGADPKTYVDVLHVIYTAYLEKVFPGKIRWGDKTTWFSNHVDQLLAYFPDAQIIHMIRDGRDVAVSYREVPHLTDKISKIARDWAINFQIVDNASKRIGSIKVCRLYYEKLVKEPESQLTKLCDFLNEEFSAEMLEFWQANRQRELEPARHMPWKTKTVMPVTDKSVGRWHNKLTDTEIRNFELIAGDALAELGYELNSKRSGTIAAIYRGQRQMFVIVQRAILVARRAKARTLRAIRDWRP